MQQWERCMSDRLPRGGGQAGQQAGKKGEESRRTANAASGQHKESRQHMEQQAEDEFRQQTPA